MDSSEKVIKKFHQHWFGFLGLYLVGIVVFLLGFVFSKILVLAGIIVLVLVEVSRRAETFYIMESGVARTYHFLSTSRKFIEYEKIQNIEVHQSFLENILGIGDVEFDTSGTHLVELGFYNVDNPYSLEKTIRNKMKNV
jgi:putative membrane protein